jgi:hypothetical protein
LKGCTDKVEEDPVDQTRNKGRDEEEKMRRRKKRARVGGMK